MNGFWVLSNAFSVSRDDHLTFFSNYINVANHTDFQILNQPCNSGNKFNLVMMFYPLYVSLGFDSLVF